MIIVFHFVFPFCPSEFPLRPSSPLLALPSLPSVLLPATHPPLSSLSLTLFCHLYTSLFLYSFPLSSLGLR